MPVASWPFGGDDGGGPDAASGASGAAGVASVAADRAEEVDPDDAFASIMEREFGALIAKAG
jgi:hypothetical protein